MVLKKRDAHAFTFFANVLADARLVTFACCYGSRLSILETTQTGTGIRAWEQIFSKQRGETGSIILTKEGKINTTTHTTPPHTPPYNTTRAHLHTHAHTPGQQVVGCHGEVGLGRAGGGATVPVPHPPTPAHTPTRRWVSLGGKEGSVGVPTPATHLHCLHTMPSPLCTTAMPLQHRSRRYHAWT